MVELIKGFVVNFELTAVIEGKFNCWYYLLNKRPRPQLQQIGIKLIIESILLFYKFITAEHAPS